ncbi:MAG: 3-hydroxyacyl-CoA dehydrogenase NAD-binding domain-containing protein, partial [Myxococcota bacterium]|nr:3-hydroxyacyl-CoA dehydrogenase NAD-binding domain-containing protein [Myxococcota bacterium]
MPHEIRKAGVIGAGVMGATIAAQLANVGVQTLLLDIVPGKLTEADEKAGLTRASQSFRNRLAQRGLDGALGSKPASFYVPENAELISVGNLEDDLKKLAEVDWIIEVVVERLDVKRLVFAQIESVLREGTIVSSNTSGISAAAMCEGRSQRFREHFAITHFFNPPRYMKLLELVPGPDCLESVRTSLSRFCERDLGKGVVFAKDTPNFIANRIGVFGMLHAIRTMTKIELRVEEVDALTGPVIGHAKSASFRTADLVGLDTLLHVARNVYDGAPEDERRELFAPPPFLAQMLEQGMLGEKTKQGFYKKVKDESGASQILSLDYTTMSYGPQRKLRAASLEAAKNAGPLEAKLRTLFYADDVAGRFTFETTAEILIYSAMRIPEIADDIVAIDNAMKWGFGWKLGPFEIWDALGVAKVVKRMKAASYTVPAWVEQMLAAGNDAFYRKVSGSLQAFHPERQCYEEVAIDPGIILLSSLKERGKKVAGNTGASLIDLGDGVACLEFHTKMNAMGDDVVRMVVESAERVERDFEGLVIGNHGSNFSAGANLPLILFTAQEEEWDDLDWMVNAFQQAFMRLKYLSKPVVAAPAGMALGGGCEICLAADRVRFAAETYMGLVEVGVGLVPAGGGTKELLLRNTEHLFTVPKGGLYPKQIELMPYVARAFETIAMAKVATSGPEAVKLGYLRSTDKMTVHRDFLLDDAKRTVLAMQLEGYRAPRPKTAIRVAGRDTLAMIQMGLWTMRESGYITEHDVTVSSRVAHILCGGKVDADTVVSEQY